MHPGLIITISVVLQFVAAFFAVRLIWITKRYTSWILISSAVILMGVRRSITLYRIFSGDITRPPDLSAELVALTISCLMLSGIIWIAPLFYSIKRSHEAIAKSETQYRNLFNNAYDAIYVIDPTTYNILDCNVKAGRMVKYGIDELKNMSFLDINQPRCRDTIINALKAINEKSANSEIPEVYQKTKDNKLIPVEIFASMVNIENKIVCLLDVHDISDRKIAEKERLRAEERLASFGQILEDSVNEIYIFDAITLKFIQVNRKARENLGYSMNQLKELNPMDIEPELTKGAYSKLIEPLQTGEKDNIVFTTVHQRKDQSLYDVEAHIQRITFKTIPAFVAIILDITERKQMEKELLKTQKLESVGILAGGIAHDFNNILTAILGNTELAIMLSGSDSKVNGILKNVESASLKARALTQQLLTFSKGGEPVKKTIVISGILKEFVEFPLRGSNVKAEFDVSEKLWPIDADEGQINQVISNLAINAQQAMPQGGVLNVKAVNLHEQDLEKIPSLKQKEYVKISFTDNGIGISNALLPKIFDPYFTTKQKGSGLGLASSYSIVKNHGGLITVESELDVGASFHIYLPASSTKTVKNDSKKDDHLYGGGRVLIMDDEEDIRDMANKSLSHIGYEVECAVDGIEAIELYKRSKVLDNKPFDVVILDLTIPGSMGGEETIKKLKEIDPAVKAVSASGYSNSPVMANFEKYGFNGCIAKPFKIKEINKLLIKIIKA